MALEGSINTPLGNVSKKTAVLGGGLAVIVIVAVWYRRKQAADASIAAAGSADINPATGFPYGSAEDAAALAGQASYISPGGIGGGGGGSSGTTTPGPGGFTNNAQWSQYVIDYLSNNGDLESTAPLATALGKYLAGQKITEAEQNLIQQAIAVGGKPPLSGDDGYPPSWRTGGSSTEQKFVFVRADTRLETFLEQNPGLSRTKLTELNPDLKLSQYNVNGWISPKNPVTASPNTLGWGFAYDVNVRVQ